MNWIKIMSRYICGLSITIALSILLECVGNNSSLIWFVVSNMAWGIYCLTDYKIKSNDTKRKGRRTSK